MWGRLIGGAAGLALGGPLGALLSAVAGFAADILGHGGQSDESPDNTKSIAFTIGVIALGAKMAKADGEVTGDEVVAFRQVFRVAPEERANVEWVFERAMRDSAGYEAYARQIAGLFRDKPAVLEEVIGGLFHIAKADGKVSPAELDYLRNVAAIFGFDGPKFERLRRIHLGYEHAAEEDPYEVLDASPEDDDETLHAAYRRLVRENHPDMLIANGVPPQAIAVATAKLAAINAAWRQVRRERGLK